MDRGYVKDWRKLLDSDIFRHPLVAHFWEYCRLKATHRPMKILLRGEARVLQPGQFLFGRKVASRETGISEQSIRSCVKVLKSTSRITIEPTNRGSVLTICQWGIYQSNNQSTNQPINQPPNHQSTSSQPAANQQPTTDKNKRTREHEKEEADTQPPVATSGFEKFWTSYPGPRRYQKKQQCLTKWKREKLAARADLILRWLDWNKLHPDWTKEGGQFIPGPYPWLRMGLWLNGEPPDGLPEHGESVADQIARYRKEHPGEEF